MSSFIRGTKKLEELYLSLLIKTANQNDFLYFIQLHKKGSCNYSYFKLIQQFVASQYLTNIKIQAKKY